MAGSRTVALLACCLLLLVLFVDASPALADPRANYLRRANSRSVGHFNRRESEEGSCKGRHAKHIETPKKNVWLGLTHPEVADIVKWLYSRKDLNLTDDSSEEDYINTLQNIDLLHPNKTDALKYMDGDGDVPERWAQVTLNMRAHEDAHYQEIMVGPLPIDSKTAKWMPLTYPWTKNSGGKIRNIDPVGHLAVHEKWLWKVGASVADITKDLWNGTSMGLKNDTLDIWGFEPYWQDDGLIRWDTFWSYPPAGVDGETLLPLGLCFKTNMTGRDPSKWKLLGWLYDNIYYKSTAEFRKAYWSKGFKKLPGNAAGEWLTADRRGEILPMDTHYPPTLVAPAGNRFSIDRKQKYVKWMDFEFYISFTRHTAMKLYDIRYKGKRIIYELGLQEALAHYAGNDPIQSGTAYLDSYYGFGPFSFELINGYDCPSYSTYLNSSYFIKDTTHKHINSICLFEMDTGYPIARHTTGSYTYATKNIVFTVRNVATVGNYDYQFSYEFYQDGSIRVDVRASGYIQSAFWAHNEEYGYHIHDTLSGSMHDHVLNYKVDFDVMGTDNTMEIVENVPVSEVYPWSDGKPRNTMKLKRRYIESEDESKLNWAANSAAQYKIVNLDAKNKFGEAPGFRVVPSAPTIHLTVKNSSNLVNSANWADHDLYVTKQKDTEPRSVYQFNNQDVYNPLVDFAKFFDGENLKQTDLVLWFNLGMHHVPHTGDLPNTVFTTAHSGMQILPLNYMYNDPSVQTVNRVKLQYRNSPRNGRNQTKVTTFGQHDQTCSMDFTPTENNLEEYTGDVVTRKWPYDPNNPFYYTHNII